MKEEIEKMYVQALIDDLPPNVFADQVLRLFSVSCSAFTKDDLEKAFNGGGANAAKLRVSGNKLTLSVDEFEGWYYKHCH